MISSSYSHQYTIVFPLNPCFSVSKYSAGIGTDIICIKYAVFVYTIRKYPIIEAKNVTQ